MNFDHISERNPTCSDDVPSILSRWDKKPIVLHLTCAVDADADERCIQLRAGHIYVIEAVGIKRFKIGWSANVSSRLKSYRTDCPVECVPILIAVVPLERVEEIETALHSHFDHARAKGEWFDLSDDEISTLPDVVKAVAGRHIEKVRRELKKLPRARPNLQEIKWRQELERQLCRLRQASAVPTDELVLDRLLDAQQRGERIDARDITKSINRRPQVVHEYLREMICTGQIAIVEPRRNTHDGSIWLDTYRDAYLILPNETCAAFGSKSTKPKPSTPACGG